MRDAATGVAEYTDHGIMTARRPSRPVDRAVELTPMIDSPDRLRASLTWQEASTSGDAVLASLAVGRDGAGWFGSLAGPNVQVVYSGAGSSYYLALAAASAHRTLLGRPATAIPPSELLIRPEAALGRARPEDRPIIAISRSGSTSEIVRLVERSVSEGRRTTGITCRADSPLATLADRTLVSPAGDERAIVMTRSFTSMLALVLRAIAGAAAAGGVAGADRVSAALEDLPTHWASTRPAVERGFELAAQSWLRIVVLGGGAAFGLANEACLKLTEMSQVAANAWEPFEFRHGPISVCEPGVLVVGLIGGDGLDEERRVLDESSRLGATIWALDPETLGGSLDGLARLPLLMPPLQALAIGQAFARGADPDRPRHLSQVVTLTG